MVNRAKTEVDESDIMKAETLKGDDLIRKNTIGEYIIELNPILDEELNDL